MLIPDEAWASHKATMRRVAAEQAVEAAVLAGKPTRLLWHEVRIALLDEAAAQARHIRACAYSHEAAA